MQPEQLQPVGRSYFFARYALRARNAMNAPTKITISAIMIISAGDTAATLLSAVLFLAMLDKIIRYQLSDKQASDVED